MFTVISFILTLLGSINWLMIGLLQFDYVAGIFGYQASVFSRIIYIIIGASSVFLVYKLIKNKGVLPVFSRRNKHNIIKNINKLNHKQKEDEIFSQSHQENIALDMEAGEEHFHNSKNHHNNSKSDYYEDSDTKKSILDDYLDEK